MLSGIEGVRWELEAQPPWNKDGEVVAALRALSLTSPQTGDEAYSRVLYALGNNHAGTYYPVVLPAIPFLGAILREGSITARLRTLDVLVDLVGSFEPEPGFEFVATPAGRRALKLLLKEKVLAFADEVERRRSAAASPQEFRLADDLLSLLKE